MVKSDKWNEDRQDALRLGGPGGLGTVSMEELGLKRHWVEGRG